MQNEIKVVIVEPHKNPTITTLKNKLENLQEAVGGLIEIIDIEDDVCILCNEEGKLIGLEGNRRLSDDILVGTFFVCGSNNEGELTSLTDSQIEKYIQFFWEPQTFTQGEIEDSIVFKFIPIEDWVENEDYFEPYEECVGNEDEMHSRDDVIYPDDFDTQYYEVNDYLEQLVELYAQYLDKCVEKGKQASLDDAIHNAEKHCEGEKENSIEDKELDI